MVPLFLPALLLACGDAALLPDADLLDDPLLAALPADAVVVGRWEVDEADVAAWTTQGLLRPERSPLEGRPERVALGCGEAGCVALVEGEVAPGLAPSRGEHAWQGTAHGHPWEWRRLAADKAVLGEADAVRALSRRRAAPGGLLDPEPLQGAVPQGEAWLLAHDSERLAELAAARGITLPELPVQPESVAVALTQQGPRVEVALRAVLVDEHDARRVARALRAADLPGLAGAVAGRGQVVRVGTVVEVQGAWLTLAEAQALADEVAP